MADLSRATKNWPEKTRVKNLDPGPIASYKYIQKMLSTKNGQICSRKLHQYTV